jgi:hypothetical protein
MGITTMTTATATTKATIQSGSRLSVVLGLEATFATAEAARQVGIVTGDVVLSEVIEAQADEVYWHLPRARRRVQHNP